MPESESVMRGEGAEEIGAANLMTWLKSERSSRRVRGRTYVAGDGAEFESAKVLCEDDAVTLGEGDAREAQGAQGRL